MFCIMGCVLISIEASKVTADVGLHTKKRVTVSVRKSCNSDSIAKYNVKVCFCCP